MRLLSQISRTLSAPIFLDSVHHDDATPEWNSQTHSSSEDWVFELVCLIGSLFRPMIVNVFVCFTNVKLSFLHRGSWRTLAADSHKIIVFAERLVMMSFGRLLCIWCPWRSHQPAYLWGKALFATLDCISFLWLLCSVAMHSTTKRFDDRQSLERPRHELKKNQPAYLWLVFNKFVENVVTSNMGTWFTANKFVDKLTEQCSP